MSEEILAGAGIPRTSAERESISTTTLSLPHLTTDKEHAATVVSAR